MKDISPEDGDINDGASGVQTMMHRHFMKTVAAGGAAAWSAESTGIEMIYRPLGRTGDKVSALGLGGYQVGGAKDEQESIRIIPITLI